MGKKLLFIFKTISIVIVLVVVVIIGIKGFAKLKALFPAYQKAHASQVYEGIEEDYTYVILEDKPLKLENYPEIQNQKIYLPIDLVTDYLNPNFYWDQKEVTLTYTTAQDVIRMKSDDLNYFVNDTPLMLNMPIVQMEGGMGYIPQELLGKFCDYQLSYNEKLDLLMIDDLQKDATYGTLGDKKTKLRISANKYSNYITKLKPGAEVRIYEEAGDWYKVRTQEGYLGYIQKATVKSTKLVKGIAKEIPKAPAAKNEIEGKISMVWHQVTNASGNNGVAETMKGSVGVDVLSPTWFAISDSEGNVSNLADVSYVQWAHDQGYQVWALFSNSFNKTFTHDVLSSTEKREKVIKQILALAAIYELDGINIDFENVAKEDGTYYVQFIKELTPYLKKQGLIVSVDMYVPSAWTMHYDRTQVGKTVDYVIIMAYDEHWSNSETSGSVASIGFVEKGITDTLREVPNEKVILGIPFYTRLWMETMTEGAITVSSKAYSMKKAYDLLIDNNAVIEWQEDLGQYYGEYVIENITYKIWLEEEKSIERKLKLFKQYDLAGTSGWKLSLEKDEVWPIIRAYVKE